jgi:DNA-binding NtrC family response regulator/tetratricopeptide (TPR) repeat protein
MAPLLFADRFVRVRSGEAIDLATARRVWIRNVEPGDRRDVAAWLGRCAALSSLWHPRFIPLADFGADGRTRFFEAWDTPLPPSLSRGGLQTVPLPADASRSRGPAAVEAEIRSVVCGLEDLLDKGVSGHPRAARLRVPGGPRRVVLVHLAARTVRLRGYVPISARVLSGAGLRALGSSGWRALLRDRHVCVLDDGVPSDDGRAASLFFLSLGLSSDRPHVLLNLELSSPAEGGSRTVFAVEPGGPAVVRENIAAYMATPAPAARTCDPTANLIGEAIASGRHARAERMLRDRLGRLARRREEAAGGETALALGRLLLVRGRTACAGRALEEARERFERASLPGPAVNAAVFIGLAWTDGGRFGLAEAALRAAGVAAAKLSVPDLECLASLALARCLYWQGRLAEASGCLAFRPAHDWAVPLGELPDDGALVAAGAGVACARERLRGASPRRALSEWSGDRWAVGEIGLAVARGCLASRIALATRDVAQAGRRAAEARELAQQSGDLVGLAASCAAKAAVYGALGDIDAVRDEVEAGLRAARQAHAPLRALRLRILMARGLREAGRDRDARRWLGRLSRLDPARLPRVVGLPLERAIRGDDPVPVPGAGADARLPRHRPLASGPASVAPAPAADVVSAVIEVLRVCQSSDDDAAVLARVSAAVRERTRAVSVACFGRVREETCLLASDGREVQGGALAQRATDTGLAVPPASTLSGLEAAVPIRFAGALVGAFVCRFSADAPPDWAAVRDIVTAAAAASGPCVRTLTDLRALPSAQPDTAVGEILGRSDAVADLRRAVLRAAAAPFNVVIEGESGSGKELVARALHRLGPRRDRPLCALNCAALADDLVEAELFGHARGAFTGAIAERKGLFEEADHGILVLDEVGELTGRAQAKLLRAIQEGEVRRVGENFSRPVDVRIVAASNRPLRAAVEAGLFRRDLIYRLEVVRIVVPPLRLRAEDIPMLAGHFWREATVRVGSRCTLAPATLAALARYDWPGNVRELQNVMAALAVAAGRRGSVGPDQLPPVIGGQAAAAGVQTMVEARRAFEAGMVRTALARAGGHRAQAAGELGLTRQGLAKLMARLGIE